MKKNTDKLVTKQDNPLGLILFSIIYFLVQEGIYPALAYFYSDFFCSSRTYFEDFCNCVFGDLLDNNIGNYVFFRIFVQRIFEKNE